MSELLWRWITQLAMAREVDIDKRGLLHCPTSGWWGLLCQSYKHPDFDVLAYQLQSSWLHNYILGDLTLMAVGGSGECHKLAITLLDKWWSNTFVPSAPTLGGDVGMAI